MKKGLGMEDMPRPFFCAFYRRIYERFLTAAESRSLSMLTLRRSAWGPAQRGTAGLRIPEPGSLSALFSYRVDQILNGAEHGQSQDSKY